MRSDPDVVAVGEMPDLATATTTLKAALTGSFVLSTLHTRDAPSAVTQIGLHELMLVDDEIQRLIRPRPVRRGPAGDSGLGDGHSLG